MHGHLVGPAGWAPGNRTVAHEIAASWIGHALEAHAAIAATRAAKRPDRFDRPVVGNKSGNGPAGWPWGSERPRPRRRPLPGKTQLQPAQSLSSGSRVGRSRSGPTRLCPCRMARGADSDPVGGPAKEPNPTGRQMGRGPTARTRGPFPPGRPPIPADAAETCAVKTKQTVLRVRVAKPSEIEKGQK